MGHSEKFHNRETEIVKTKSGATSSKIDADFHDLPYAGLLAAARRFAYGRKRHGRFNWKQGDCEFAEERLKHLVNHVMLFCEERKQEDLDALVCNALMIAWFYSEGKMSIHPIADFMYQGKEENVSDKELRSRK